MHTTPPGGLPPTGSNFPVRFGAGPAPGRLPLRQGWQLLQAGACAPPLVANPQPARAKFALVPQGSEGEIWALNERALREGRRAVEQAHAGGVAFAEPKVHTYVDPVRRVPMEPLMFVKLNARREHMDPMLNELRSRGARMHEIELQGRRVLLRAEARLSALLGLEDAVAKIATNAAQVFSWLIRYEPVPPNAHLTKE